MIEAFEIGVSLALQDGVSESISQAQRDVAGLRKAVQESGVSVQSLQRAAANAVSPPIADRRGMTAEPPAKRTSPEPTEVFRSGVAVVQPEAAMPAPVVPGRVPAAPDEAVPVVVQGVPVAAPSVQPGSAVEKGDANAVPPAPVWQVVMAGPVQAPVAVMEAVPPVAGVVAAAPVAAVQGGCEGPPRPVVRVPEPSLVGRSDPPSAAGAFADHPRGTGTAPRELAAPVGFAGASDFLQASPPITQDGMPPALPRPQESAPSPVAGQVGSETASRPWSGVAAAVMPSAVTQGGAGQASPAAPPAQRHEAGPPSGDVFLDGMLVGRWMSRFLNQEAGRASAGPTGFDPRRGRLLPGVTVGG